MVKRVLLVAASLVFSGAVALAATQNPCNPCSGKGAKAGKQTIVGYIGDSMCGLNHAMGGDEKGCTMKCLEGGAKLVLADRDGKVVYNLDSKGQGKAKEFAGQKVKVSGSVDAKTKTITVNSIEAAS